MTTPMPPLPNPQPPDTQPPDTAAEPRDVRFVYPSGSRPLEGYTIKRGVGHGGFGEVYYAVSDGGKEVALKLVRRNLDVELRGVQQCLNLKHPHLLGLYDVRQDSRGDSWVVMEFIRGEGLQQVLDEHPHGLSPAQALAWFRPLAQAVGFLHDQGIVHRDLKPGNIFADGGIVKLGDYGLAKFISASRRSGQTESVGTVHYMAPEIASGRYGKEVDVYALGVLLCELLTGRVPFEGESVGEVLMKHLTAEPELGMLAEPYRGVVQAALAKDPAQRPQSVAAMLAMLPDRLAADAAGVTVAEYPAVAELSAAAQLSGEMPTLKVPLASTQPRTVLQPLASLQPRTVMQPQAVAQPRRFNQVPPAPTAHQQAMQRLAKQPPREQLTTLLGSLLLSAVVVPVLTLIALVLIRLPYTAEQFSWLTLTATTGTWGVLALGSFWQGREVETARRRFVMLFFGLALGLIGWGIDEWLLVNFSPRELIQTDRFHVWEQFDAFGQPLLGAYLAYFAVVMGGVCWWRLADPLRRQRVDLWQIAKCFLVAWLVQLAWPFSQPWGWIVVGLMAFTIQIASRWESGSATPQPRGPQS